MESPHLGADTGSVERCGVATRFPDRDDRVFAVSEGSHWPPPSSSMLSTLSAAYSGERPACEVVRMWKRSLEHRERSVGPIVAGSLAAVLACVGLLIMASAIAYARSSPDAVGDQGAAVTALVPEAGSAAADVLRAVRPAMERTRRLASQADVVDALRTGDQARLDRACNDAVTYATEVDAVVLYDTSGTMVAINTVYADGRPVPARLTAALRGDNYAQHPIIGECLENSIGAEALEFQTRCQITPVYFDSSGLSVAHSIPVFDDVSGEQLGVLSARMRSERLAELLEQTYVAGGHGNLYLVTEQGQFFNESINSGAEPPPIPPDELRDIVRMFASGHAQHSLLERDESYLALSRVYAETVTGGGLFALITVPASWAEAEATLLLQHKAAIRGLLGVLTLSLGGVVAGIAGLSARSQSLRQAENRFQRAVRGASDGFWDRDLATNRVWYSPRFKELLGFDPHDDTEFPPVFDTWLERVHPHDVERTLAALSAHLDHGQLYDVTYRLRARTGEYRHFRARGEATRDATGQLVRIAGSLQDITQQIRAEEELRRSESHLHDERNLLTEILSAIPFRVFWKAPDSRYLGCNEAFARAAGLDSVQDLVGKTDAELPWPEVESAVYRTDDEIVMRTGTARLHAETTYRNADGAVQTLSFSKVPLHNDAGQTTGVIGIYADVTEHKQLEAQLAQAQKLESIGQLAAGIAHEINTPTQFISDNIRFLQDNFSTMLDVIDKYAAQLDPDTAPQSWDERRESIRTTLESLDYSFLRTEIPLAIEQSLEGLDRVSTIIGAMKDFSHPARSQKEPINLNRAIESTATVCRNRWKYVAELELDLAADLPEVQGFAAEINQAILNLIVNAADAIGEAAESTPEARGLIRVTTQDLGDAVELRVVDNGPGMPDSIRSRIFDPFFTTKDVGAGTGQGLAICRDAITQRHGGSIRCESAPGEGATFIVTLPIDDAQARAAA